MIRVLTCQPRVLKSDYLIAAEMLVDFPLQSNFPDYLSIHNSIYLILDIVHCTPTQHEKAWGGWMERAQASFHSVPLLQWENGKALSTACKCCRKHTCNMHCSNSSTCVKHELLEPLYSCCVVGKLPMVILLQRRQAGVKHKKILQFPEPRL